MRVGVGRWHLILEANYSKILKLQKVNSWSTF
jgi:hypothetical protein